MLAATAATWAASPRSRPVFPVTLVVFMRSSVDRLGKVHVGSAGPAWTVEISRLHHQPTGPTLHRTDPQRRDVRVARPRLRTGGKTISTVGGAPRTAPPPRGDP